MPDRAYTDAELDAAIEVISDPERLRTAQDVVARTAPALQRVLSAALADGGWFGAGHEQAVSEASNHEDPQERRIAVRTLIAEETRLGMLVGVAIGFALARELAEPTPTGAPATGADPIDPAPTDTAHNPAASG